MEIEIKFRFVAKYAQPRRSDHWQCSSRVSLAMRIAVLSVQRAIACALLRACDLGRIAAVVRIFLLGLASIRLGV
jgi:hypothetical protein